MIGVRGLTIRGAHPKMPVGGLRYEAMVIIKSKSCLLVARAVLEGSMDVLMILSYWRDTRWEISFIISVRFVLTQIAC